MAGSSKGNFRELISPFLREKISKLTTRYGENDLRTKAIINQYVKSPLEDIIHPSERLRHYESEINIDFDGAPLIGVERLYRRTVLIEPTTACAAHCRWCLRGQYPIKTMQYDDIERAARYIGSSNLRDDVNEVLITGGDPLLSTSHHESTGFNIYQLHVQFRHSPVVIFYRLLYRRIRWNGVTVCYSLLLNSLIDRIGGFLG